MERGRVQVFVDDYVTGRLPAVCARTGVQTGDQMKLRTNINPVNPFAILLILLGPVGWLLLFAVLWSSRSYLEGWLPYSNEEAMRRRDKRRSIIVGTVVVVIGLLLVNFVLETPVMGVLSLVAAFIGLVMLLVLERSEPGVELDASGRWVTLRRVHPAFVEAATRSVDQRTSA